MLCQWSTVNCHFNTEGRRNQTRSLYRSRERELKHASMSRRAFCPDSPSVSLHDGLGDGQMRQANDVLLRGRHARGGARGGEYLWAISECVGETVSCCGRREPGSPLHILEDSLPWRKGIGQQLRSRSGLAAHPDCAFLHRQPTCGSLPTHHLVVVRATPSAEAATILPAQQPQVSADPAQHALEPGDSVSGHPPASLAGRNLPVFLFGH